ncbi:glycine-rich protein DOT1-like [Sesamum indicum]|uniref:Glycine-rich protein DOT1-like n=1 Tax=Sesamum indicum TaxID=4182 RepID=A0A6I9SM52_SESIN|nr:glycine-rich protein DOT1-like [Sesamum indicum]
MEVSAFTFSSGLGQEMEGPAESPMSDFIHMKSMSSSSSELHRELCALRILKKSPWATNLSSAILNGAKGGGGGSGISGDGGAMITFSWHCGLDFVGFGGLPVWRWRSRGGVVGGGGGAGELSIDEGGGGGGEGGGGGRGGGAVVDCWNRLLSLLVF